MSIFKSGLLVSLFTLLSKISGLLREQTIAYVFGAGAAADCLNVSLKFPNLFRRILGEGALSSVFVPMYSQKMHTAPKSSKIFANQIFTLLICTSIPITIMMQIFAPQMLYILAPGFIGNSSKFALCVIMCRITMPYLILITLSALLGGILNATRHYLYFAFSPILFNAVVISSSLLDKSQQRPYLVAYGILLAGALQFLFMHYSSKKYNLSCHLTKNMLSKDSKFLLIQMLPAIMSFGVTQISIFISLSLASFIEGAISILSYAERLFQLPLALIGTAFGTLLLPELARFYGVNDFKQANSLLENSMKLGLIVALPAAIGLGCISDFVTCLFYQRGAFTASDTYLTAQCLIALCLGLPASILNKILTPAFYANCDVKTPFKITIYTVIANIILNITLMKFYGILGVATASSISAWFNTCLLLFLTHKMNYLAFSKNLSIFIIKLIILNLIILAIILYIKSLFFGYFYQGNLLSKILSLFSIILISSIVYLLLNLIFRVISKNELNKIKQRFAQKV